MTSRRFCNNVLRATLSECCILMTSVSNSKQGMQDTVVVKKFIYLFYFILAYIFQSFFVSLIRTKRIVRGLFVSEKYPRSRKKVVILGVIHRQIIYRGIGNEVQNHVNWFVYVLVFCFWVCFYLFFYYILSHSIQEHECKHELLFTPHSPSSRIQRSYNWYRSKATLQGLTAWSKLQEWEWRWFQRWLWLQNPSVATIQNWIFHILDVKDGVFHYDGH